MPGLDQITTWLKREKCFWTQRGLLGIILLAFSLGVSLWLRPYVLSAYYTEVAGRLLEECLIPVYTDRLAPEHVLDRASLQAAVEHLEEAIRLDPRNVQARRLVARAYLSLGEPQAALEALQAALAIRPQNPLLHLEVADVYDSLGYAEAAQYEYEKGGVGSRRAPLAANYLKLADAQIQTGSGEVAIHLWYKTLGLDVNNLYALYHLYRIHYELGDMEHAAIYWERLALMDPQAVAVPLDFRLAEYQAWAMIALVEEGMWAREKILGVLSDQVHRVQESGAILPRLMVIRTLETLLKQWSDDPDLLSLRQAISAGEH